MSKDETSTQIYMLRTDQAAHEVGTTTWVGWDTIKITGKSGYHSKLTARGAIQMIIPGGFEK